MPYADGVLAPEQRAAVRDALGERSRADAEVRELPLHPRTAARAPSMKCSRRRSPRGCSRPCAAPAPAQRDRPAHGLDRRLVAPGAPRRHVSHARLLAGGRDPGGAGRASPPAGLRTTRSASRCRSTVVALSTRPRCSRRSRSLPPAAQRRSPRLIARRPGSLSPRSADLVPPVCLDLRRRPRGRRHRLSHARWRLAGVDVDPAGARRARARPASRRRGAGWQRATKQRKRPRRCPLAFKQGDVLGREEEADLIKDRWKTP